MPDIASAALHTRTGQTRTIDELTTLFDLCLVVVDAHQPHQIDLLAPVIRRIHHTVGDADCTAGVLVVGAGIDDALGLSGPLAAELPVFADPDSRAAGSLGVAGTPALLWITTQPAVAAVVPGWDGNRWRPVIGELAAKLAWTRPLMPAPGDPAPIEATPLPDAPPPAISNAHAQPARKEEVDDALLAA